MHSLIRLILYAMHGKYRHLKQHAQLAENGMDPANIFLEKLGQNIRSIPK